MAVSSVRDHDNGGEEVAGARRRRARRPYPFTSEGLPFSAKRNVNGKFPLTLTLSHRERGPPGSRCSPGIHSGATEKGTYNFNGYILIAMVWPLKTTGVQRGRFPLKSANRRSADKGWPPRRAARGDSRHDVELSRPQADDREVSVVRSTDFSAGPGGL